MRSITGNNSGDMTELNRSAVVKILQRRDVCSRAEIARLTGLTQAAITKIVAVLIDMGIVSEVGSIEGAGNRRAIGLRLNSEKYQVVSVKFARNLFVVGTFDLSGKIYNQHQTEYAPHADCQMILNMLEEQIQSAIASNPNVVAVGMAVPGPYLRDEGRIAVMTQMTDWHAVNFIESFKNKCSIPFFLEHDAKAGALASWWFEEWTDSIHSLAYFLLGDGVGAGVVEEGDLILGTQGTATEVGHISVDVHGARCECGNYGCLELYCSAGAMIDSARKSGMDLPQEDTTNSELCERIFKQARKGDASAQRIVRQVATYIGYGCVNLINGYNPDVIVLGDIVSRGGDLLLPIIREVVSQRVIAEIAEHVRIELTTLCVDPTLCGAAAGATNQILQSPTVFLAPRDSIQREELGG